VNDHKYFRTEVERRENLTALDAMDQDLPEEVIRAAIDDLLIPEHLAGRELIELRLKAAAPLFRKPDLERILNLEFELEDARILIQALEEAHERAEARYAQAQGQVVAVLRASLSQPEHQGDGLADDLRAMARDAEDTTLVPVEWAEPLKAAADCLSAQPLVPALSDEEREHLEAERNKFAELAGWDFESDSEEGLGWEFERIKKQCVERQHEDSRDYADALGGVLTQEQREYLVVIADALEGHNTGHATFLRSLASREHRGEEGAVPHVNDPAVEGLGDAVGDRVKAKLAAVLFAADLPEAQQRERNSEPGDEENWDLPKRVEGERDTFARWAVGWKRFADRLLSRAERAKEERDLAIAHELDELAEEFGKMAHRAGVLHDAALKDRDSIAAALNEEIHDAYHIAESLCLHRAAKLKEGSSGEIGDSANGAVNAAEGRRR
jgi:hypothetical protein